MTDPMTPRTATVAAVAEQHPGTVTLTLELPGPELAEAYQPGQFNMLGLPGFGEAPVAFDSLPTATVGHHTVRSAGRVTRALARLRPGDAVQLRGPFGTGWPLSRLQGSDVVVIMGGMGVIPLRPLVQRMLERRYRYGDLLVLYGAREPDQMLFRDEVLAWGEEPGVRVRLIVDEAQPGSGWEHAVGVVTDLLEHPSRGVPADLGLVCGPELMMRFAVRELLVRGMLPGRVYLSLERHMKCGIGHCGHCQIGPHYLCRDGPVLPYSRLRRLPDTML